jgi:hypothetical protein
MSVVTCTLQITELIVGMPEYIQQFLLVKKHVFWFSVFKCRSPRIHLLEINAAFTD